MPEPVSIGLHLAEAIEDQWSAYSKRLKATCRKFSNRNVHELRVQTRRLMARLALIRCAVSDPALRLACKCLRRRLKTLGSLRDVHVQLAFVCESRKLYPQVTRLRKHLKAEEKEQLRAARCKLLKLKDKQLHKSINHLGDDLREKSPSEQVALAQVVWRETKETYRRLLARSQQINPSRLKSIHRTRVAFKRYRYLLESLPADLPRPDEPTFKQMADYQRLMGEIQDMAVMRQRVLTFMARHKKGLRELAPFLNYLRRRTLRLVDRFMAQRDEVKRFSPSTFQVHQSSN